jgi:hypothetical protein
MLRGPAECAKLTRKKSFGKPPKRSPTTRRTGAAEAWLTRRVLARPACDEFGRAHGLKPHRLETFKVSRDPQFVEKLEDIIGLYLNPPQQAVVFSVDEKSQIQALDRHNRVCR